MQVAGRLAWRGEQLNAVASGVVRALGDGAAAAGDDLVAAGIAAFSAAWGGGLGGLAAVVGAIGDGVNSSSTSYVATDRLAADGLAGLDGA